MSFPRRSAWWLALALLAAPAAARADLFVTSNGTDAVLEYNGTTGAFVKTFASGGGLNSPNGLVFGPNGDLFVSSQLSNEVREYNGTTGAFVKSFASGGGLSGPTYLTFGPSVPEPSSLALLAVGGLVAAAADAARRRRGTTRA